ncbi:MAG: ribosome biogenesis GTPase YlqF [Clostridiales bacterium]|jgi:ribosome biogenesis GTPase A|nr:ribosome biogenesis GTPase YlqF [Clostridiales bacterium]
MKNKSAPNNVSEKQIQWYPGHMAKTKRLITEHLKLVDVVLELVDARIPISSRNPDIDSIVGDKPRVILLNKADLADSDVTLQWKKFFTTTNSSDDNLSDKKTLCVPISSTTGAGFSQLKEAIIAANSLKIERDKARGITSRPTKLLILGVPNVGKSAFINRFTNRAATKTGDKAGVTQHLQWVRIDRQFELLDTPGILWAKFDNRKVALNLAYTGAIKGEVMDLVDIATNLCGYLISNYKNALLQRYSLAEDTAYETDYDILLDIGKKRGCLMRGGEIDDERAAKLVLDDFRSARLGRISLEKP